jgi:hypothetical protein
MGEALPLPANHRLGANEVQGISPPSPSVREPHPEEAIEAPELRSLGAAAEQGELLPERQVLEREVGAVSERRAERPAERVRGALPFSLASLPTYVQRVGSSFVQRQAPRMDAGVDQIQGVVALINSPV